MAKEKVLPWSFTIEFDEEKVIRNGYTLDTLYEYVDKNVQQYGLTRLDRGTWKANENEKVESQCLALSLLSRQPWVMQNIASFKAYENNTNPIDIIEILKKRCPARVYA